MKINVRIAALATAFSLYGASVAGAQEVPKPDKVARDVSKATKKAGGDTKAETKRKVNTAHGALADPGKDTKSTLNKATGIKAPQPGGLNKMAGDVSKTPKKAVSDVSNTPKKAVSDVSNTPKKAVSDVKAQTKHAKGAAHGATTEAGKSMKDAVPKSKP